MGKRTSEVVGSPRRSARISRPTEMSDSQRFLDQQLQQNIETLEKDPSESESEPEQEPSIPNYEIVNELAFRGVTVPSLAKSSFDEINELEDENEEENEEEYFEEQEDSQAADQRDVEENEDNISIYSSVEISTERSPEVSFTGKKTGKKSQAVLIDADRRRTEKKRAKEEKRAREKQEHCEWMHGWLSQRHREMFGSNRAGSIGRPTLVHEPWTDEEDYALLIEVQNKRTRNLPATERYLAMLNNPLLRSKYIEDIRARALHFKDIMEEQFGPRDFVRSLV